MDAGAGGVSAERCCCSADCSATPEPPVGLYMWVLSGSSAAAVAFAAPSRAPVAVAPAPEGDDPAATVRSGGCGWVVLRIPLPAVSTRCTGTEVFREESGADEEDSWPGGRDPDGGGGPECFR